MISENNRARIGQDAGGVRHDQHLPCRKCTIIPDNPEGSPLISLITSPERSTKISAFA